jgi:undecaprenyl diphosphate synthase
MPQPIPKETPGSAELKNILLIPDGDRRWAQQNNTTYEEAYETAAHRIVDICSHLGGMGIRELWMPFLGPFTLAREEEDGGTATILEATLDIQDISHARGLPMNVTAAGRLRALPAHYARRYEQQQAASTAGAFTLHHLLVWSTNTEIVDLASYAQAHPEETLSHEQLMAHSPVKQPIDYIIRTGVTGQGGRLSGLAPWHSTDAELYFTDTLFPDFTTHAFQAALDDYSMRGERNRVAATLQTSND